MTFAYLLLGGLRVNVYVILYAVFLISVQVNLINTFFGLPLFTIIT